MRLQQPGDLRRDFFATSRRTRNGGHLGHAGGHRDTDPAEQLDALATASISSALRTTANRKGCTLQSSFASARDSRRLS